MQSANPTHLASVVFRIPSRHPPPPHLEQSTPARPIQILSGINAQLRSIQAQSADAALLPGAAASLYNLTGLVLNATQLGHVAQYGLYNRLVAVSGAWGAEGWEEQTGSSPVVASVCGASVAGKGLSTSPCALA